MAATVGAIQPLLVAMLSAGLLGERLTVRTALAAVAGVAGGLLLLPVALLVEGAPPAGLTAGNLMGYAYLSLIGPALAYALWFRGLRALSATKVTFLGLLSPVVATALGWVVLGQDLTAAQALGALVVLAALLAAQLQPSRPRPAAVRVTPRQEASERSASSL